MPASSVGTGEKIAPKDRALKTSDVLSTTVPCESNLYGEFGNAGKVVLKDFEDGVAGGRVESSR
jgi:hypothetical protein